MGSNPRREGHRKRLRERFEKASLDGVADYELLEILLAFVIPRRDMKPAAKDLLRQFRNFKGVLDAAPDALAGITGVGPQSALFISAIRAAMRRYFALSASETDLLSAPEAVVNYGRASLEAEKNEVFEVLFLTSKNRLIRAERVAEGTIDRTAVYARRVIESALKAKAAAMIFLHNHPSGDPSPSEADRLLTDNLVKAAKAVGVAVHDHIIIGNGRHYSFHEHGHLK